MNISTADKYAHLVEEIYERTTRHEITWEQFRPDSYVATLGKATIEVGMITNPDSGGIDIVMRIYDGVGNVIDSFSDVTLADATPRVGNFKTYYLLMEELHRRSGREATGAERILDEILDELGISSEKAKPRTLRKPDDIPF